MPRILSFLLVFALFSAPLLANPTQAKVDFLCTEVTEIPLTECEALVALYNSTNGPGWVYSNNWLVTLTPSDWYGVTVDEFGHVIELNLDENGLNGSLPVELKDLTNLMQLSMGSNQITGSIPLELGSLLSLEYLYLSDNQLSGEIPLQLSSLSSLVHLYLNENGLSGIIPSELSSLSSLVHLDLSGNQLSGTIPSELGILSNLEYLFLNSNQLSGEIPPQLGNLVHLSRLYLYDNLLTGPIPPQLGDLIYMWNLWLSENQLTGPIPPELRQLSSLVWLRLADNQLSGTIPAELGELTGLWQLSLGNNQLTGSIPTALSEMTSLMYLSLTGNQLDGAIPPELGLLTNLYELDLSANQFSGAIPAELGNLEYLGVLLLNNNQLTGDIPESLINLINLEPPGTVYGGDGLNLDYNWLNVPQDYPDPENQLQLFLSQYDPDWHTRQAFSQVIGIEGGEIISLDGRAHFLIPETALAGDTTFNFIPLPALNHEPPDLIYANHSFQLTAEDALGQPVTSFALPLTVSLAYTETDIPGINEYSLALHYWDSGSLAWLDAITTCDGATYSRDALANTFSLPLCHLSDFAVFGASLQYTFLPFIVR